MAAAIAARSGSGTIVKALTAVHIEVTGDAANQSNGTENRRYILVDAPVGVDDARSHVFQVSSDGKHTWNDYIFPAAGSYTLRLRNMADDTDVATAVVTVAAS
jgi:hypothetical protein